MTFAIPMEQMVALLLGALRAGMLIFLLPLVGGPGAPSTVRVLLSFSLGALLVGVPQGTLPPTLYGLLLAAGRELVIGLVLGLLCQVLLAAPALAGDLIAQELGLKMAEEVDPFTRVPATAPSRVWETSLLLLFLATQGHHDVMRALHQSFLAFPVGGTGLPPGLPGLVQGLGLCMRFAVMIVAPLFAVLLCGSVVLAMLARAVPELQVMSFGYPLRLLASLAAAVALFPLCLHPGLKLIAALKQGLLAMAGA